MIDINLIRSNPDAVKASLKKKECDVDFSELLSWDAERRALISDVESLKARKNKVSADIPRLKKEGKPVDAIFDEMRKIGEEISEDDKKIDDLQEKIFNFVACLPNLPDDDLVAGGKENNAVQKVIGKMPEFDFAPKNHVDLCTSLNLIDYERGVKLSGGGFWMYRGVGARLEWALLNFFISEHLKDGYEFILPPLQLGYNCGFGAGQFPKFSDEVYWLDVDEDRKKNRFMLPTAETALVNIYSGEIIDESKLPMKMFAYTPCFRKEAGSYRSEERGMIRGHQFNKVEMVQYTHPDHSDEAFEELVNKASGKAGALSPHIETCRGRLLGVDGAHDRYRGLDSVDGHFQGSFKRFERARLSGKKKQHPFPRRRNRQNPFRAYLERQRTCDKSHPSRACGTISERRRLGNGARGFKAVYGRT